MQFNAWLFRSDSIQPRDLSAFAEVCRAEGLFLDDRGAAPDPEDFLSAMPSEPGVVFLPAIEQDCIGVKLLQNILGVKPQNQSQPERVIVLYAGQLPRAEFLCLAFREGADDIIALEQTPEALATQVRRARKLLASRIEFSHSEGDTGPQLEAMREQIEILERQRAKWEERLLGLASTAYRMASGELRLAEAAPVLLIVSSSNSQAASARAVAERMGFDVHTAHMGQQGLLELVAIRPSVILTDGTLPDMDGSTFARTAREALGRRAVVIIAWSSNPENEDKFLAPESGIDDFVLKSAGRETTELLTAAFLGALR